MRHGRPTSSLLEPRVSRSFDAVGHSEHGGTLRIAGEVAADELRRLPRVAAASPAPLADARVLPVSVVAEAGALRGPRIGPRLCARGPPFLGLAQ